MLWSILLGFGVGLVTLGVGFALLIVLPDQGGLRPSHFKAEWSLIRSRIKL